jgi:sortase A
MAPSNARLTVQAVDPFGRHEGSGSSPSPAVVGSTHRPRGLFHSAGRALVIAGALSLLFAFFQFGVANISERRSQRALNGAFRDLIASGAPLGAGADGKPHPIDVGDPVAILEIPSLGLRKIVVEGTGAEQLKRGPGHVPASFVPGQYGHAVIAGRRTTYGSPFRRLDLLREGDEVITTTPYGRFTYRVRTVGHIEPRRAQDLEGSTNGLLTLVTSNPPYTPNGALVVDAELTSDPSTFADPPRPKGSAGAVDFTGNPSALLGVLASGLLLFAAVAGAEQLYRRWRRWPTYLITTPIILALLFAWMDGLLSTLPSTL